MRIKCLFLIPVLLGSVPLAAQEGPAILESPAAEASRLQEESTYERATEALDRGSYEHAIELYQRVMEAGGDRYDAATYWLAFAEVTW